MNTLEKVYLVNHLERSLSLHRRQKRDEKKQKQTQTQNLVRIQNVPTGYHDANLWQKHGKINSSHEDVVVVEVLVPSPHYRGAETVPQTASGVFFVIIVETLVSHRC